NIQLYHSHMTVTPVVPPEERPAKQRLGWHQDSGRLNQEMETEPRPRISLKVAFFLTDTREAGRGNFSVIPGSHRQNQVEYPAGTVIPRPTRKTCRSRAGSASSSVPRRSHRDGPPHRPSRPGCPLGGRFIREVLLAVGAPPNVAAVEAEIAAGRGRRRRGAGP